MINVLQLIVRIPLFSLSFPVNVQMCFSILIDVTNFNVISTDTIESSMFIFTDTDPFNDNFSAIDIF
jgi:hypothetical protein